MGFDLLADGSLARPDLTRDLEYHVVQALLDSGASPHAYLKSLLSFGLMSYLATILRCFLVHYPHAQLIVRPSGQGFLGIFPEFFQSLTPPSFFLPRIARRLAPCPSVCLPPPS